MARALRARESDRHYRGVGCDACGFPPGDRSLASQKEIDAHDHPKRGDGDMELVR